MGPTCHTGARTCFDAPLDFFKQLEEIVDGRFKNKPKGSYVAGLIKEGTDRMAQKVGEEAVETVIASKNSSREELISESADLVFHLMVLLRARGTSLSAVAELLRRRNGK
jgi:phosphoribosyl-ATP pyrophosphohydrolase/phosphoribosyl-AMP cyclohydrolase